MATTTVINPDKDTWLWKGAPTNNYGTTATLRLGGLYGGGAAEPYNVVMEFDVSAFTDPSAIISANLDLTRVSDSGSVNNTVTVRRLDTSFVESGGGGCTWNNPDTGSAVTWDGGEDFAVTNVPDQTFSVGVDGTSVTVDISSFVIDAIQRRSGVLRLVFFMTTHPTTTGWTKFASTKHATSSKHPTLTIIEAARIVWGGTNVSGDMDDADNWTGGLPAANDYVYFIGNEQDITAGSLDVNSIFIGKNFTGNFGVTLGFVPSSISMACYRMLYSSPYSQTNLTVNDGKGYDGIVRIGNSNNQPNSVTFTGETEYRLINTGSAIELTGTDIKGVECHSPRASFTSEGTISTVNITGGSCRLENSAASIYAVDASLLIENSTFDTTDLTQRGGFVRLKADTVDALVIYAGTLTVRGNEGAPITIANLSVYPNARADLRTKSNTIETTNPVKMYGGRVLLDGNVNAAVS